MVTRVDPDVGESIDSVQAERNLVEVMLLLRRRCGDSKVEDDETEDEVALPTLQDLELHAVGLRALALLPPRFKDVARPLARQPGLIVESLLRCLEIGVAASLLSAFPSLIDGDMLARYALAALRHGASTENAQRPFLDATIITTYFDSVSAEEKAAVDSMDDRHPLYGIARDRDRWLAERRSRQGRHASRRLRDPGTALSASGQATWVCTAPPQTMPAPRSASRRSRR